MSLQTAARSDFVYRLGRRTYDLSARTYVMGILNVTPDSFSDGGLYFDPARAVERALKMVEDGADFIDVGGESTRPRGKAYGHGSEPVTPEEELQRVLPVIRRLAEEADIPISIDTYKAAVAREACSAGASIVNDISGFHSDPAMAETVASAGATAILMHMRGNPRTMQADPSYSDLFGEICTYLAEALAVGQ